MLRRRPVVALSLDYDGCSDVLNDFVPNPIETHTGEWPRVRPFSVLRQRRLSAHVQRKRAQFWAVIARIIGTHTVPDVCMSGSARILYQHPLHREQDGIAHTVVLDDALAMHGMPILDLRALGRRDGGTIDYRTPRFIADLPVDDTVDDTVHGKLSILYHQLQYVRRLHRRGPIHLVFLDDIYATKIARTLRLHPNFAFVPHDAMLHLVHYESFDPSTRVRENAQPLQVRENVFYWPKW